MCEGEARARDASHGSSKQASWRKEHGARQWRGTGVVSRGAAESEVVEVIVIDDDGDDGDDNKEEESNAEHKHGKEEVIEVIEVVATQDNGRHKAGQKREEAAADKARGMKCAQRGLGREERKKRRRILVERAKREIDTSANEDVQVVSHVVGGKGKGVAEGMRGAEMGKKEEVVCVGEGKGVRALVDYPHFRFHCGKVGGLEDTQDGELFCERCFCYVCDVVAADCSNWTRHCWAVDWERGWRDKRRTVVERKNQ